MLPQADFTTESKPHRVHSYSYLQKLSRDSPSPVNTVASYNLSEWIGQQLSYPLIQPGASCSVICSRHISQRLTTGTWCPASQCRILPSRRCVMSVCLGTLKPEHSFMILDDLSTPGCDFLMKHNIIIDFGKGLAYCTTNPGFQHTTHFSLLQ